MWTPAVDFASVRASRRKNPPQLGKRDESRHANNTNTDIRSTTGKVLAIVTIDSDDAQHLELLQLLAHTTSHTAIIAAALRI